MDEKEKQYKLERVLEYYGYNLESEKFKIVCPFHEDNNASLLVDLSKGNFYCFGCQKKGEAMDFVKYMENVDDLKALILLEKILNGTKEKKNKIIVKHKTKKQIIQEKKDDLLESKNYYYNLKKTNWFKEDGEELDYLLDRGFIPSVLNKYGGKITYNSSYPIVFPIMDNGVFKGYVCRTTDLEIQKKRKYLYNKGFRRSITVCGDYHSKTVMVVEGYFDFLKAKQFGVNNVVALLGWKASDGQIQRLKEAGVENIICALDNDECGKKGVKYLRNFFNVTRFVFPKNIKDIGEMQKETFLKQKEKTIKIKRKKEVK